MKALVVYESMFGNTEVIARAIAKGLSSWMSVDVAEVNTAPTDLDHLDLLVVGSPTQMLGMSRARSRQEAGKQGADPRAALGRGVREWLDQLVASRATLVAAFDTRVLKPKLPGSAARGALRRMRKLDLHAIAPAESFYVAGTSGPLVEGEEERALHWGESLAMKLGSD